MDIYLYIYIYIGLAIIFIFVKSVIIFISLTYAAAGILQFPHCGIIKLFYCIQ